MNGQLLLAGLLCALALNAVTAWIHWARAPRAARGTRQATSWGALSAILQTLPVPLVFVIVLLQPDAFTRQLERTPYGSVLAAVGLCVLVVVLLWRLFVELTYSIPAMRREHAEAALGRRVLSIARRQRLLPASADGTPPRALGPASVLVVSDDVSDDVSDLLDEEIVERPDDV